MARSVEDRACLRGASGKETVAFRQSLKGRAVGAQGYVVGTAWRGWGLRVKVEQLQGHWWSASGYREDLDSSEQRDLHHDRGGERLPRDHVATETEIMAPGPAQKFVGLLWGLRDCTQLLSRAQHMGPDTQLPWLSGC